MEHLNQRPLGRSSESGERLLLGSQGFCGWEGDSGDRGQMGPLSLAPTPKGVKIRTRAQVCVPTLPVLNYTL